MYVPDIPLHSLGWLKGAKHVVRAPRRAMVAAPNVAMAHLGHVAHLGAAAQIVGASSPLASTAASAIATSAGWGSAAGPIGAAVGVAVGLIAGLLAAHELRIKQAKDENSAVDVGVNGFDSDLRTIQQAYKSGQVDIAGAIQAGQVALQNFWALVTPHIQPGRNGCAGGAGCTSPSTQSCDRGTAGQNGAACCIGCVWISPAINGAQGLIAALQGQSQAKGGPYVLSMGSIPTNKYSHFSRGAYTLDFTPPAGAMSSVSGAVSSVESAVTGNPLLLIGLAIGAFFLLR